MHGLGGKSPTWWNESFEIGCKNPTYELGANLYETISSDREHDEFCFWMKSLFLYFDKSRMIHLDKCNYCTSDLIIDENYYHFAITVDIFFYSFPLYEQAYINNCCSTISIICLRYFWHSLFLCDMPPAGTSNFSIVRSRRLSYLYDCVWQCNAKFP